MERRRKRLALAARVSIAALAAVPLFVLLARWYWEGSAPLTLNAVLDAGTEPNGYIEIQAVARDAQEPTFQGKVFVLLWKLDGVDPFGTLTITRSPSRDYASSIIHTAMISDTVEKSFRMADWQPMGLVMDTGHPSMFPFDSAQSTFNLRLDPNVRLHWLRVRNFVPGFDLVPDGRVGRTPEGDIHVEFGLRRKPLIQYMCIFLGAGSVLFAGLILTITKVEALATSVASYFFSLWSLRG